MGKNTARAKRRNRYRAHLVNYKKKHPCLCGESRPHKLTFHHLEPEKKLAQPKTFAHKCQFKKMMEEVEKCVVLCRPCHDIVHNMVQ